MNTTAPTLPPTRRDHGPLMLAVALAAVIVVVRTLSPGIPDTGDGIAHYQHARYFWHETDAALSQWGKPVFSLLASPFAAMGMWGMAAFAAVCGVATCAVIMAFLNDDRRRCWAWAVPLLLFFIPVYVHTVLCGLTEPFFGLVTVLIVLCLWKERFAAAMVLLSVMPFVRPEYAAFAPFVLAYVLWRKAWKALPWLLTGVVVYSLASAVLHGRPFAFFTEHTYAGNDIYGRGDGWLFYDNIDNMYGLPFKRALKLAVLAWAVLIWRDRERRRAHIVLGALTLLPAIAIFCLHSYAWWHGGMASLGLLRVIATTVPLLVLFTAYTISGLWALFVPAAKWTPWVLAAMCVLYGNTAYHELRHREPMPVADDDLQHTVREAAAYVNAHRAHGQRLYFLDPYIGALCDRDPWDMDSARALYGMGSMSDAMGMKEGDWVAWDAHFAANEGGLELDSLMHDGRFRSIAVFEPPTPVKVLGDRPFAIHLFQRMNTEWSKADSTLYDLGTRNGIRSEQCDTTGRGAMGFRFKGSPYPLALVDLPFGADDLRNERLIVRVRVADVAPSDTLFLAFVEHQGAEQVSYHHDALHAGEQEIHITARPLKAGLSNKLYVWNLSQHPFTIERFEVLREAMRQRPR